MRGCSNRQNPRPGRGRSRTYVSSRSMDIDTWSFGRFRSLARAVFPFSLVPVVPIDAEVRRWETRGTQACGFEGKLAWVVTQGAAVDLPPPSPPRPPYSLDCSIVGLPQGDRGSMVSEAGACSAEDCCLWMPLRPMDSAQASAQTRMVNPCFGIACGYPAPGGRSLGSEPPRLLVDVGDESLALSRRTRP